MGKPAVVETEVEWTSKRGICDHCGAEDEPLAAVNRLDDKPGAVFLCPAHAKSFLDRDPVVTNFVFSRLT